jgi:hypothetical protein
LSDSLQSPRKPLVSRQLGNKSHFWQITHKSAQLKMIFIKIRTQKISLKISFMYYDIYINPFGLILCTFMASRLRNHNTRKTEPNPDDSYSIHVKVNFFCSFLSPSCLYHIL